MRNGNVAGSAETEIGAATFRCSSLTASASAAAASLTTAAALTASTATTAAALTARRCVAGVLIRKQSLHSIPFIP